MAKPKHIPRRASDFQVGDTLTDGAGCDYGRIIAIADHPTRPIVYFLCGNSREEYTIEATTTKGICAPWLARQVPKPVMEQFLFEAFVGMALPPVPPGPPDKDAVRVPLTDLPHKPNPPQAVDGKPPRSKKLK